MVAATEVKPVVKDEFITVDHASELLPNYDERQFYRVKFQLGANQRWRSHGPGKWVRDPERDSPVNGEIGYKHIAAVHVADCIPGAIVNGMLVQHNEFLTANRKRGVAKGLVDRGDINRMLLVLEVTESTPPRAIVNMPLGMEAMLAGIAKASAEAAATAAVAAIAAATKGGQKPAKE